MTTPTSRPVPMIFSDYNLNPVTGVRFPSSGGRPLTLDLWIDTALLSENPIIKAFAMVDRRLGRRRLSALVVDDSTPDIVKVFHALRMETMRASNRVGEGF